MQRQPPGHELRGDLAHDQRRRRDIEERVKMREEGKPVETWSVHVQKAFVVDLQGRRLPQYQ